MVSFDARQRLKVAARILVLAAVAAPCAGIAQFAFERTPNDQQQRQIIERIQKIQLHDGPFSADLIDPLMALSLSYREHGDRDLASSTIERARQVVRVNYGLHSLKEASLIRQEIHNETARGDAGAAWHLEQKLLALVNRHPNDLGVVPILREIADERMDIVSRYRAGDFPPQIVLGCYYDRRPHRPLDESPRNCGGGSRDVVIRSLFAEAQSYYTEAIGVIVRNRRYSSDELRELSARLIRASYLSSDYIRTSQWWHGIRTHDFSTAYSSGLSTDYLAGRQGYSRLVTYNAAISAPRLARVATLVEMTDWVLLFSQHAGTGVLDGVVNAYQQAYDSLEREDIAQTSIDEIFSPKIPVVLPAFLPNPLVSKKASESSGYIDVAFGITKYGRSKHIEILDTTNAARLAERDLIRLIEHSRFRPRVTDGRFAGTSRVVVRYYLND